jgi:hypothetical protein
LAAFLVADFFAVAFSDGILAAGVPCAVGFFGDDFFVSLAPAASITLSEPAAGIRLV